MARNHSPGYRQPIMELLYSAEVLGFDFERPGKLSQLRNTTRNAVRLHADTAKCIRVVEKLSSRINAPEAGSVLTWLRTLERDFREVAANARKALRRFHGRKRLKSK